jgi:pectate lyase-like protein
VSSLRDVSVELEDGHPTAPSLYFKNSPQDGLYLDSPGVIGIATAGIKVGEIGPGGIFDLQASVFNVKQYGAKVDGTTDDTVAVQRALDVIRQNGGGVLYIPVGTCLCAGALTYPAGNLVIAGAGMQQSTLKLTNPGTIGLDIGTGSSDLFGITFRDISFRGGNTTPTTYMVRLNRVYVVNIHNANFYDAPVTLHATTSGHIRITGSLFNTNITTMSAFIDLLNCSHVAIVGNTFEGKTGSTSLVAIRANASGTGNTRWAIVGNAIGEEHADFFLTASSSVVKNLTIIGNSINGSKTGGIRQNNPTNQEKVTIVGNTLSGASGGASAQAILARGTGCIVSGNVIKDYATGISMASAVDFTVTGNVVEGATTAYADNGTADKGLVANNNFVAGTVTVSGTNQVARNNRGFVTEAKGTGSIASGATTAVITHGLGYTPALGEISVTLGENPTNDVGAVFVTTITSTQFTVNVEADPGASNLDFAWAVRRI